MTGMQPDQRAGLLCSQAGHFVYLGSSDVFCDMFTEAFNGCSFLILAGPIHESSGSHR